jgi:ribonuclease HII
VSITVRKRNGSTWRAVSAYLATGKVLAGIDEVGRGAWAGPVVAAAVILPNRLQLPGLADSKLMTLAGRERLNREIRRRALAIGLGWVSSTELDANGLTWAVRESGLRALAGLAVPPESFTVILDGSHNYLSETHDSHAIVKADALVTPVAAASVIAKVARDHYMTALARLLPGYGFEQHKGYGTVIHRSGLTNLGPSSAHRLSYAPLRRLTDPKSG